jgi:hypothetical protein
MSAIERRLAKLEDEHGRIEEEMAAHDPSDYEGLASLNERLKATDDESAGLEAEWMELGSQVE